MTNVSILKRGYKIYAILVCGVCFLIVYDFHKNCLFWYKIFSFLNWKKYLFCIFCTLWIEKAMQYYFFFDCVVYSISYFPDCDLTWHLKTNINIVKEKWFFKLNVHVRKSLLILWTSKLRNKRLNALNYI